MRAFQFGKSGTVNELAFAPDAGRLAASVGKRGVFLQILASSAPPVRANPRLPKGRKRPETKALVYLPDGRVSFLSGGDRYEIGPAGCRPAPLPHTEGEWFLEQAGCGRWLVATTVERPDFVRQKFARHRGWVSYAGTGWTMVWEYAPSVGLGHPATIAAGSSAVADRFFLVEHPKRDDSERTDLVCRSAATGEVLDRTPKPGSFFALVSAADGSAAVGVGYDELVVWRPGGAARAIRCEVRRSFTGAAFHPSGAYLAVTHDDGTVRLYDTEEWHAIRRYDWGAGPLRCVAFSPDGTLGAAGLAAGRVILWDCD